MFGWFGQPFPYERVQRFGDVTIDMVALRRGIAVAALSFGVGGALALFSPAGASGTPSRALALAIIASSVPLAVLWWRGPWPSRSWSIAFVAYADLAVSTGVLLYSDPLLAMAGTSLLITTGIYVTLVHSGRVIVAHVSWAAFMLVLLLVRIAVGDGDVAGGASLALALTGGLVGLPVIVSGVWHPMRAAAWASMVDPLTGLLNRRGLEVYVPRMVWPGPEVVVAVLDLDRFKLLNDTNGHAAGDRALARVGTRLTDGLPAAALSARIGGEEFAVVVDRAHVGSGDLGQLLLGLVHDHRDPHPVTASIGLTVSDRPPRSRRSGEWLDRALDRADGAMYVAKEHGGHQVALDRRSPITGTGGA